VRRRRNDDHKSAADKRTFLRPLLLLALTVFIDLLGFGIIIPNLPRYIETAVGNDHRLAASVGGLLAASYSFTQFLFAPLWGRYSDRVGRRPVLLLSLLGVAASFTLFGLAGRHLWMLFAARLLAGVLSSASIGVAFAYVADVTTPENRARGLGLLGACFGLGFLFGPAIGGELSRVSLGMPAFVAAGMALVNFVFTLRFLPESLSVEAREKARALGGGGYSFGLLLRVVRGPAGFLFALTFLVTLSFTALEQTFGFYLLSVRSFGVTDATQPVVTGRLLGLMGLIVIVVQGAMIGRLVDRFGEGVIALWGIALMVLGFLLFPLPRELWALAAGPMIPLGLGSALTRPALSTLVSHRGELGQGLTLSTSSSFDSLARTVGPVLGGWLFYTFGPSAPYQVAAFVMAAALLLGFARRAELLARAPVGNPVQGV
jgi:MFS family permease